MQSHYEINVSKDGQHFFATHERSAVTLASVRKLYKTIKDKFPESEGYAVSVTKWECYGKIMKEEDLA